MKKITFGVKLKLDTKITPGLKKEGIARELIRHIQEMRKQSGLEPKDKILIRYSGEVEISKILKKNRSHILKETLAKDFSSGKITKQKLTIEKEIEIDGKKLWLGIKLR